MYQLGRAFDANKDYSNALRAYTFSAKKGNKNAQYKLGKIYEWPQTYIKNSRSDRKKSFFWHEKSAKQGHNEAQLKIGKWYRDGGYLSPVKQDCKKALDWLEKSAAQNNAVADEVLAKMYLYGNCAEKDNRKAFDWFLKGAKNGNAYCKAEVAEMYARGRWVKRDNYEALRWYKSAVGDSDTYFKYQSRIADLYYNGNDCSIFDKMAKFCKKDEYYGLRKNYLEAFKWEMKAAMQGYGIAQESISKMYDEGKGVKKNYILAYTWLNLAKSNEDASDNMMMNRLEEKLNKLEAKMTLQQIAIAQAYDPIKANKEYSNSKNKKIPSNTFTGTGFFINKSTVITNHHVVKRCKDIELVRGDYRASAKLSMEDSRNDLAVLKTTEMNDNFLHFRAGKGIRIGEEIIVLGYPLGKLLGTGVKLTTGNVSSLTGLVDDATNMQITAPVQPGNSGGPLLDSGGNIVGIIVARLEKDLSGNVAQNVNIAIKSNVLQMLLDTKNIDYDVSMSKDKKEVADIGEEAKESIVQVVCHE